MATVRIACRALARVRWTGLLAALSAASSVHAQQPARLYAGIGALSADYRGEHERVTYDDTSLGVRVYGGYRIGERAGVEIALDGMRDIGSGDIPGSGLRRLEISARYSRLVARGVFGLSLAEVLPRRPAVRVFATAGVYRSHEERVVHDSAVAGEIAAVERDAGIAFGAGASFKVGPVNLRAEIESFDTSRGSSGGVGISAEFRFGE